MLDMFDAVEFDTTKAKSGVVYLIHGTNELVLYLGTSGSDDVHLYHLGVVDIIDGEIVRPEIQLPYVCSICNNVMDNELEKEYLRIECNSFKIHGMLVGVDFRRFNNYAIWYAKYCAKHFNGTILIN